MSGVFSLGWAGLNLRINFAWRLGMLASARPSAGGLTAAVSSVLLAALASLPACNRPNPLYHPDAGPLAGAAGAPGAAGDQGAGTAGGTGTAGGAGGAAAVDGGGSDATLGACKQAADCIAAHGVAPCGNWQCRSGSCAVVCPQCVDMDRDGYGVGAGCAGPDCDDTDPTITANGSRSCYDGKPATAGVGPCHAGTAVCTDGSWSSCVGQVVPSGEACNGADDDCNGKIDDGLGIIACGLGGCAATAPACVNGVPGVCKPGVPAMEVCNDGKDNDCDGLVDDGCDGFCVHVAPNGDDMGTGTALRPFRTIQAAIDYASGAALRPKNVCVAGGDTCVQTNVYQSSDNGTITMANGVSVLGSYEATNWTRCLFGSTGLPNLTVTIQPRATTGVVFGATVTSPTVLDGVRVARFSGGGGNGTIAGITVNGAKQVQISNVVIDDAMNAMTSYGVNLVNGGEALITRSAIFGGAGSVASIGVHAVGSKPTIRENCATIDPMTGHCTSICSPTSLGIHGRSPVPGGGLGGGDPGAVEAVGVDLVDSPNAVIERNAICGTFGATGDGVRIAGMAAGTVVRGNWITADNATTTGLGVSLLACMDAAPWIVDNELVAGDPSGAATRAAGVNVVGACHPVIDSNTRLASGASGSPQSAYGVYCGPDMAGASRCAVVGNKLVQGSPTVHPAQSIAVACDGACARVSGNTLVGQGGATVIGLSLRGTAALVDRNIITGGCGSKTTTAVLADDASSRIENNVVRGASCGPGSATPEADGVRVHVAMSGNEIDVNSNTIDAGGAGLCQSVAAGIGLGNTNGMGPKTPHGIFRDNILRAGGCATARVGFIETEAMIRPRLFENNDLDTTGAPTSLYSRPAGSPMTIADVNMLSGAAGNISADPMFVGVADLHLMAGSPCINAGTPVGAPKVDFDGKARDDKPDIGAFEH
jgi:hypothetical protein